MTLLALNGFEAGDMTARGFSLVAGVASRVPSTRFGYGYMLQLGTSASTVATFGFPTPSTKVTVGVAFMLTALPGSAAFVVSLAADAGATQHTAATVNPNGSVSLTRAGVVLATSAAGLVGGGQWHYWELTSTISDTVGVASLRLDGAEVATFTGDTKNSGTSTLIDSVKLHCAVANNNGWHDDLYVLNDQGPAPWNAPLGDCRVQTLVPTGAGALAQLTPVGSANNWDNVDELPPSVTDYNSSSTPGQQDTYTMSDLILGTTTILGVSVNANALKNDAGARSLKNLVRVGGTNYAGSTRALAISAVTVPEVWQTNPATSAAWTPAEVNAIEAGVEVV